MVYTIIKYGSVSSSVEFTRGGQVIFEQTVGSISIEVDI